MPSLTVPSLAFGEALAHVISSAARDGATRPILSAIHVKVRTRPTFGLTLEAADNFRVAIADVISGDPKADFPRSGKVESFVIPLADAKAIAKAIPKAPKYGVAPPLMFAWARDGSIKASINGWSLAFRPLDRYPDIAAVEPKGRVIARIGVNASLLADLAVAIGGKDGTVIIELRNGDPSKAHEAGLKAAYVIRPAQGNGRHGILMPVRVAP